MSNDSEEAKFNITGLPLNTPFEVDAPDEEGRAVKRSIKPGANNTQDILRAMENITPEKIMKIIPEDQLKQLKEEVENTSGMSFDDILKMSSIIMNSTAKNTSGNASMDQLIENLADMLEQSGLIGPASDSDSDGEDLEYTLGDSDNLHPEQFGSIPIYESSTLYEEFLDKYGSDTTKYLDDKDGITDFFYTDLTVNLMANINIKEFKYIVSTNQFIIFYAVPEDETKYGYFVAVVKTAPDKFSMFVPEFANTFKVNGDGSTALYGPITDPLFFVENDNGDSKFRFLSMTNLIFSIRFCLAPIKNVILSPKKFGTIRNVITPITRPSAMLKIGNITSNETPEAILFKKDAEIPLEEQTFPMYIKFKDVIGEPSLKLMQQILFKVDFNKCDLLDYCELKWTNDHKLYIEIDLDEF